jgi:succinate-semialdehyde dehydrogenase / glutarate-semialdehyde dehydrogenase
MLTTQPRFLIGDRFTGTSANGAIPVINPCNEEVLWEAPSCGAVEVAEALAHARAALPVWSKVHGWERAKFLRAIASRMTARKDELARVLSQEIGRPYAQSAG